MATSVHVTHKHRLNETPVEVNKFWGRIESEIQHFTWEISNSKKLKKHVKYYNECLINKHNWTFTITKMSSLYAVVISAGNYQGIISCFVRYNDDVRSRPVRSRAIMADRIGKGLYKVNFPVSIVKTPGNACFQKADDSITLDFALCKKYRFPLITVQPRESLIPLHTHYVEYYEEISNFYKHTDFVIRVENNKVLEAHKAILAARSSYFCQYIQNNCKDGEKGEITFNTTVILMLIVLNFIYTGEVFYSSSLFNQILQLSEMLGLSNIGTLKKKHQQYVESHTYIQDAEKVNH